MKVQKLKYWRMKHLHTKLKSNGISKRRFSFGAFVRWTVMNPDTICAAWVVIVDQLCLKVLQDKNDLCYLPQLFFLLLCNGSMFGKDNARVDVLMLQSALWLQQRPLTIGYCAKTDKELLQGFPHKLMRRPSTSNEACIQSKSYVSH